MKSIEQSLPQAIKQHMQTTGGIMEATTQQLAKAHLLGYCAAVENRSRAPAQDKEVMKIVAELSSPEHTGSKAIIKVLQNFHLGYQMYCDQLAAEVLKA